MRLLRSCSLPGGAFPALNGEGRRQMRQKSVNLDHEEMHSKVEYIVAHGIVPRRSMEKQAIIGSHHFVFEDETVHDPDRYGGAVLQP